MYLKHITFYHLLQNSRRTRFSKITPTSTPISILFWLYSFFTCPLDLDFDIDGYYYYLLAFYLLPCYSATTVPDVFIILSIYLINTWFLPVAYSNDLEVIRPLRAVSLTKVHLKYIFTCTFFYFWTTLWTKFRKKLSADGAPLESLRIT